VKKAIEEACPEIAKVEQVRGGVRPSGSDTMPSTQLLPVVSDPEGLTPSVRFISPFAMSQQGGWRFAAKLGALPEGGILAVAIEGSRSLLLARNGPVVACFENACAHLGMPLDMGEVADGVLTCPYHGFRYDLRSGECLTAPEVQLEAHAVRVVGDRIEIRLSS
jgi:nitrite reductase/ring-hydroxylating ferredoxin subunit